MMQSDKNEEKNRSNKYSITSILMLAFLYLISLIVVTSLFALSFSWLVNGIDQLSNMNEVGLMPADQIPVSYEPSLLSLPLLRLLTLPSVLTWLLGIIAAKVGGGFVDFSWDLIKKATKSIWNIWK